MIIVKNLAAEFKVEFMMEAVYPFKYCSCLLLEVKVIVKANPVFLQHILRYEGFVKVVY